MNKLGGKGFVGRLLSTCGSIFIKGRKLANRVVVINKIIDMYDMAKKANKGFLIFMMEFKKVLTLLVKVFLNYMTSIFDFAIVEVCVKIISDKF